MRVNPQLQKEIDARRKWLDDNESNFLLAQETLSDVDNLNGFLRGIKDKAVPLMSYNPRTDDPHVAVYVVACMQERLVGIFDDLDFVDDYVDKRETYRKHIQGLGLLEDEEEPETTG